jgi:putative peptidoglycan lipid II flippase
MGTTLGYGQGMEYQYVDVPQPSQPMVQLRQERLQQLREERMRRQQRRGQPDVTVSFPWTNRSGNQAPPSYPVPPSVLRGTRTPFPSNVRTPSGYLKSPLSLPAHPEDEIVPVRSSTVLPDGIQIDPKGRTAGPELQPASAGAQDTGMLQKVRIGRATFILTVAFVASRVLGLLRTSMFAFVFGTSNTSDAYLQAFLVPDLIFNIVAGGALSSAFIPVFTNFMVGEKDEKRAWHVASAALNLAVAIMTILALVAIIFARALVPLYNPGVHDTHQLDLIATLTRIMLLQSILLGGGVIVTAVLNAKQDFKRPAVGTVLYNVGLIAGLLPGIFLAFSGHRNDNVAVYAATWGVVLGALLQLALQIPGLFRVKMKYTLTFDWRDQGVVQIGRQMLPRIVNSGMIYLSTFVDRGLIQLLGSVAGAAGINGLITQYYQSFQLVLLPYGIFGLATSTAAFPTLAENVAKGRFDRVRNTILETLRSILFMSIPSSVGLIVLGLPIIQVLLQHGYYTLNDAEYTAVPLAFFAVGLGGLAAVEILTRSFYAMRDTKTPVIVSVIQFAFKIALSIVLINVGVLGAQWGLGALAFATSLANTLEAVALFWLLNQRIGDLQVKTLCIFIVRVLLASVSMGVCLIVVRAVLDLLLVTTRAQSMGLPGTFLALIKLLIELFVGIFVYIRSSRFLGIEELGPVKRILDRLKLSWI